MRKESDGWGRFLPGAADKGEERSEFAAALAGQVVLVAGAGGYLGSAVARVLAREDVRLLVLMDSSEQGLFELQRAVGKLRDTAKCVFVLGSVGDDGLMKDVFTRYRPQIVLHAAAFKHVGMLEGSPLAAIENNVLGTDVLVRAAFEYGAGKFVLVSTDKAVRPHSVMGVSKRVAELLTVSRSSATFRASVIRLGNVIGSTGSVAPIFWEQIAEGGPVSVTHPEVSRYFLSREEAVAGILAAAVAGCDARVLLPEMGEPVRVADVARYLMPAGKMVMSFTGLRPGEKLHEDLLGVGETQVGSVDGRLAVLESRRLRPADCERAVERLAKCVGERDVRGLLQELLALVPEYVPSALMQDSAGRA